MIAKTSGGRDRWQKNEVEMKAMMTSLSANLVSLIHNKLGDELIFIVPITQEFMRYKAEAFKPYEILMVELKDIADFKPPETKKRKCYLVWYQYNPLKDWVAKGIITKDDCIFMLGKSADFKDFSICEVAELWMNTEGDLGIKFKDCDKYHNIVHSGSGVIDDKVTFEDKVDDCKCGIKGATFTIVSEA